LKPLLIIGPPIALFLAIGAHRRGLLTARGAAAATVVGTVTITGGLGVALALLFFFCSSVALGRYLKPGVESVLTAEQTGPRDWLQVIAVGLVPAAAAAFYAATRDVRWAWVTLAALAFATADTWATAVGMTAPRIPRILGFGARATSGLSGAMTLRGTGAALGGALALGLWGALWFRPLGAMPVILVSVAGFVTSLLDSVFGATIQARLHCAVCGQVTELRSHCDRPSVRVRGFLSNWGVNLVCSLLAALLGWLLWT
jgi:uncharacterized protein (TIGR00297 family)